MAHTRPSEQRPYVLGHSPRELDRLELQGALYRDASRRALLDAGVESGMRVFDAGCGTGDLARLAAGIVGSAGSVLGVDRDERAVASARLRTRDAGCHNVAYEVSELDGGAGDGFDALIGRFVLMHQPDPVRTLAALARTVRPGGVVVFLESFMTGLLNGPHSFPRSGLYDAIVRWKCRVVAAAGADIEAGLRLHTVFREAGLPDPTMRMEATVGSGADSPLYRYMAESVRSMLPVAATHGIGGFDAASVDTLESRLRREIAAHDGVFVCWPIVAAWCRTGGREPP